MRNFLHDVLQARTRGLWITSIIVATLAMSTCRPVFAQAVNDAELIAPKSEWKYNDSGQDLGAVWQGIDYDDSDWLTGAAPLGYGDSGMGTSLRFGEDEGNKFITQYFRKEFTVVDPDQYDSLILRVQRDDGIAVYINDELLLLDNLPVDAAFNAVAEASVDGTREEAWVEASWPASFLVSGRNVIAVEVHQSSSSSSDTRFDAQLLLAAVPANYGEVRVGIQTSFEEAGLGAHFFRRDPLAEVPEIEMNWTSVAPIIHSAQTAEAVDNEIHFYFYDGFTKWESERIDTRNFKNVRVRVNVVTEDESNDFESSDYFRADIDISTTGGEFQRALAWFYLKGGSEKAIEWTEIINGETTKKVAVPTSAREPEADWMDSNFDDSAWLSGTKAIGYETGTGYAGLIGIDVLDLMYKVRGSCFIRIPFSVANVAEYSDLQMLIRYDDGYVAFLNGTEFSRRNAPSSVAWNSTATDTRPGSREGRIFEGIDVKEAMAVETLDSILNEGENILTIIGLNTSVGNADFLNDVVVRLGKTEEVPFTLDSLNSGRGARKTTLESPVGLIPDDTASMRIRFRANVNDDQGEVIYIDDVQTLGVPLVADSYFAFMQLETGWLLEDPRISPDADPDGDSIPNLLEYAFSSHPHIASLTTIVKGKEVPILPVWDIDPAGFATVSYRQISARLESDGDSVTEGFHVQDVRYVAQISRGELDPRGEMIWSDAILGGEEIFEQRVGFEENEDGTMLVKLHGLRDLSSEKETYVRLRVEIVGFEPFP